MYYDFSAIKQKALQAQKFTVTLNEGLLLTACSETLTALYKHKYSVCVLVLWKDSLHKG